MNYKLKNPNTKESSFIFKYLVKHIINSERNLFLDINLTENNASSIRIDIYEEKDFHQKNHSLNKIQEVMEFYEKNDSFNKIQEDEINGINNRTIEYQLLEGDRDYLNRY